MADGTQHPSTASAAALEANERGAALARQGRNREAAAAFDEACRHDPDFAEALSNLGATLRRLGEFDVAIVRFEDAIRAQPDFAPAHYNLGNALAVRGDATAGWGLYLAGRFDRELGQAATKDISEQRLRGDVKFAELMAEIISSVRRVNLLERQQATLRQFFSPTIHASRRLWSITGSTGFAPICIN